MNKTIKIDGLDIFYQEYGTGNKCMLLLHGWGQSHSFWKDFINRFAKNYHLYVLDLPGFGMSQEPSKIWRITEYAAFLHAFVTKLNIVSPILIGHSFGGRIAILYASQFPLKKLILYSTGGGIRASIHKTLYRNLIIRSGKYFIPNLLYKSHTVIFRPKDYINKIIVNRIRSRRMLDIYSLPAQNLEQASKNIKVKTLIIVGEKDFITKPVIGKKLHALITPSELVNIPHATYRKS